MNEIPDGHMWKSEDGAIMRMHHWHRWFAWKPAFVPDHGWVWLREIERRFSSCAWPHGPKTWVAQHRLLGSGLNLADANPSKSMKGE